MQAFMNHHIHDGLVFVDPDVPTFLQAVNVVALELHKGARDASCSDLCEDAADERKVARLT